MKLTKADKSVLRWICSPQETDRWFRFHISKLTREQIDESVDKLAIKYALIDPDLKWGYYGTIKGRWINLRNNK